MNRKGNVMKTINRNNIDELNLVDKASLKNLKKKSKYLRKMKQKNGNINLFEQSGEVKQSFQDFSSYEETWYWMEDCV